MKRFPANPEGTQAHYHLADSYRRLADQEWRTPTRPTRVRPGKDRTHHLELHKVYLTNAKDQFLELADLLDKPEGKGLLTLEEQVQVPFQAADCLFDLGDYAAALTAYRILADRYPDRLEGLNALGGMVRCYSAVGDTANMQQRLTRSTPCCRRCRSWCRTSGRNGSRWRGSRLAHRDAGREGHEGRVRKTSGLAFHTPRIPHPASCISRLSAVYYRWLMTRSAKSELEAPAFSP